jgi:hypothetical protein
MSQMPHVPSNATQPNYFWGGGYESKSLFHVRTACYNHVWEAYIRIPTSPKLLHLYANYWQNLKNDTYLQSYQLQWWNMFHQFKK